MVIDKALFKIQGAIIAKLDIVSAVSGDFLSVSVAPISEEKLGGSARSFRALSRPKIWQNPRAESFLFKFNIVSVVFASSERILSIAKSYSIFLFWTDVQITPTPFK